MASDVRTRRGEIIQGLLRMLSEQDQPIQAKDAIEALREYVSPNEHELGFYKSGGPRWPKVVRFATIGPVKAGWIDKNKGFWSITDAGREALVQYPNPTDVAEAAGRLYRKWKLDFAIDDDDEVDESTADMGDTLESAQETAWAQIRDYLGTMNPYDFQDLVGALLRAMGYVISWTAPRGPDGGLDIVAYTDPLGAEGPRIKVQVKRQQSTVSVDGLRSFMSLLGQNDVGLFVNLGGFTRDAKDNARHQETRRMTLLDAGELFDLWIHHYSELSEEERRLLPLRRVHYLDSGSDF